MIANHWPKDFTAQYGHIFPESYLVLDMETSCRNNRDSDIVYSIGHALIQDRRVVDQLEVFLNWADYLPCDICINGMPGRDMAWLKEELEHWIEKVEEGKRPPTLKQLKGGMHPAEVIKFYDQLFESLKGKCVPIVMHNGFYSEERKFKAMHYQLWGTDFAFGDNEVFDTGAIEKANNIVYGNDSHDRGVEESWLPHPGDTMKEYFRACCNRRSGVEWNLQGCMVKYGLVEQHNLDTSMMHTALWDALCCHYLMEHYRTMIERDNSEETPFDNPNSLDRAFNQEVAANLRKQKKAKVADIKPNWEPHNSDKPTRRRGQRGL